MKENHIARLIRERDDYAAQMREAREAREALVDIMHYLQSTKFHGVENDYVHVSTDMMPKLIALQFKLIHG